MASIRRTFIECHSFRLEQALGVVICLVMSPRTQVLSIFWFCHSWHTKFVLVLIATWQLSSHGPEEQEAVSSRESFLVYKMCSKALQIRQMCSGWCDCRSKSPLANFFSCIFGQHYDHVLVSNSITERELEHLKVIAVISFSQD